MIKFLFLPLLPLFFYYYSQNVNVSNNTNQTIKITVIDSETNEPLTGVYNQKEYSDINGNFRVRKGENLDLKFISYERLNIKNIQKDTIIKMSPL